MIAAVFREGRRARARALPAFLLLSLAAAGCQRTPPPEAPDQLNRLAGHTPAGTPGVRRPEKLADGALSPTGDYWDTALTTIIPPDAQVTIDLGQPVAIGAAMIQADNNDVYLLQGSMDGQSYFTVWAAPPVRGSGMRMRTTDRLSATARYLKLSASGGDGVYSVSELQVYTRAPAAWPEPPSGGASAETSPLPPWILLFGICCVIYLLFGVYGQSRDGKIASRVVMMAFFPLVSAALLLSQLGGPNAFVERDVALLRALIGVLTLLAVVRPFIPLGRGRIDERAINGVLGLLALAAVGSFFNLGRAQFWDAKLRQPSYVHNYDMRVYFPVAKYFHELRYDGVYVASVAAFIDNTPGQSVQTLGDIELRDLRTHQVRRVRDVAGEIEAVRHRFTPERWVEFRNDMRYFHETMGRDYFSTLTDHGGNATPVWLTVAHLMFAYTTAGNGVLLATGLLDPLLLLLFAVVTWRVFGLRTALLCLIVFGANDFYMFGTNWSGSTLRNDWMIALGLGAAALKKERWYLGGALLAYAGLIRAFPAIAVLGLMVPLAWWVYDYKTYEGEWPGLKLFAREHEGTLRALASVAVSVVVMFLFSSLVLGPSAWIGWAKKAALLTGGYHVNHVSLRSIIAADFETWEISETWSQNAGRLVAYGLAMVGFFVLTLRAGRTRPPYQAALIALFLIPVVTYAANYYFHFVFLLPILGATTEGRSRRDAFIWGCLSAMCAIEYPAAVADTLSAHFVGESAVLLGTFVPILVALERESTAIAFGEEGGPDDDGGDGDGEEEEDEDEGEGEEAKAKA
jgi:hypothetical protein